MILVLSEDQIISNMYNFCVDSSEIGGAESALPIKSIGLSSHGDPCPLEVHHPRQRPHNRVRRSRRLVERSTKIKRESADQRYLYVHVHVYTPTCTLFTCIVYAVYTLYMYVAIQIEHYVSVYICDAVVACVYT